MCLPSKDNKLTDIRSGIRCVECLATRNSHEINVAHILHEIDFKTKGISSFYLLITRHTLVIIANYIAQLLLLPKIQFALPSGQNLFEQNFFEGNCSFPSETEVVNCLPKTVLRS